MASDDRARMWGSSCFMAQAPGLVSRIGWAAQGDGCFERMFRLRNGWRERLGLTCWYRKTVAREGGRRCAVGEKRSRFAVERVVVGDAHRAGLGRGSGRVGVGAGRGAAGRWRVSVPWWCSP